MLNWTKVLMYVKSNLSLPSAYIEKTDQEIKDYIKLISLPTFSRYFPNDEYTSVVVTNSNYKHPIRNNWFYFFDDSDREILSIKECYFTLSDTVETEHPIIGPTDFNEMKGFAIDTFQARFFKPFSDTSYSYKFRYPNIVEILPVDIENDFTVWYERVHPEDLSTIPLTLQDDFMNLCLADLMINIGNMRSHYGDGTITTPFGEIPLKGRELKDEGNTMKQTLIDKWTENSLPSITIDIG